MATVIIANFCCFRLNFDWYFHRIWKIIFNFSNFETKQKLLMDVYICTDDSKTLWPLTNFLAKIKDSKFFLKKDEKDKKWRLWLLQWGLRQFARFARNFSRSASKQNAKIFQHSQSAGLNRPKTTAPMSGGYMPSLNLLGQRVWLPIGDIQEYRIRGPVIYR